MISENLLMISGQILTGLGGHKNTERVAFTEGIIGHPYRVKNRPSPERQGLK
jgi:hypothetical protein